VIRRSARVTFKVNPPESILHARSGLTSRSVALDLEPELRGIAIALIPRNEEVLRSGRDESDQKPGRVTAHLEPVWQALT
jgi:hypothetical protein